jgi:hypothetical protein
MHGSSISKLARHEPKQLASYVVFSALLLMGGETVEGRVQIEQNAEQEVTVTVQGASASKSCTILFHFDEEMQVVRARCKGPPKGSALLEHLFPGDAGTEWPHDVTQVAQSGTPWPVIDSARGKPYRFVSSTFTIMARVQGLPNWSSYL